MTWNIPLAKLSCCWWLSLTDTMEKQVAFFACTHVCGNVCIAFFREAAVYFRSLLGCSRRLFNPVSPQKTRPVVVLSVVMYLLSCLVRFSVHKIWPTSGEMPHSSQLVWLVSSQWNSSAFVLRALLAFPVRGFGVTFGNPRRVLGNPCSWPNLLLKRRNPTWRHQVHIYAVL